MPAWARIVTAVASLRVAIALVLHLSGQASPPGWSPVSSEVYVLLSLAFGALGTILVAANRNDPRAAWLGGAFVLIATTLSRQFLNIDGVQLASLARVRLDAFLPAFLWYFVGAFPVPHSGPARLHRLATLSAVAFGATAFVVNLWPFVTKPVATDWYVMIFGAVERGTLYWPIMQLASGSAFAYLGARAFWMEGKDRRQVRFFVGGLVGGAAPFVIEVVLEGVFPAYWTLIHTTGIEPWMGALLFGALATVPFSTAYSVFFDHVVELRLLLRSAAQYLLAKYTIVFVTAIPFLSLALFVVQHRTEPLVNLLSGSRPLLLASLTAIGLVALRARAEWLGGLDRRFFREVYDTRQALDHLLLDARQAADASDLETRLHGAFDRILHAPVKLFVPDEHDGLLKRPGTGAEPLSVSGILMSLAIADRASMDVDPDGQDSVLRRLPPDEQRWVTNSGARLLLVLIGGDRRPVGLVAVGPKQSGLAFSRSDRRLIEGVGASASLALDNLRLRAGSEPLSEPAARECPNCASVSKGDGITCRCGGILVTASAPYVLRGVFQLDRRIGAGGMGVVYHAMDRNLGRSVAVKTLPRATPEHVERLRREARAMAAIAHPNLAVVYGLETWQGIPFLIEEYLGGGTLSNRLASGPLPVAEALDLSIALADALVCLHAASILHCDIKPSNIAFSNLGTPKLLDFGVARLRDAAETTETWGRLPEVTAAPLPSSDLQPFGTPAYMSPEALRHEPPSALFDLWSLSVVLYESIAGARPGPIVGPADLIQHRAGSPEAVSAFLSEALNANFARRPRSAMAMAQGLRQLRSELQLG